MSDTSTLISLYGTPMSSGQVIEHLKNFPEALGLYYKMPETHRQDFLDFCSGKTGLYLCYDVFFQKIFNPYIHRERVKHLLGALLGQEIHILEILSREGLRMSDSASLVIMDLVLRLQDGTIINLELDSLSHPIYIPLDIFHQVMQNKPVNTPLEAWLTALTTRSLARIDELIRKFPVFSDVYREVFEFRTTPEELITMYSAALAETDRSTERVMISDMQKALADKDQALAESKKALADSKKALADSWDKISVLKEQIRQLQEKL